MEGTVPLTTVLINGHIVERSLFRHCCRVLKVVASIKKESSQTSPDGKKYEKRIWTGGIAMRELWLKSYYPGYEISASSAEILSRFELCDDDGSITKNIRNIVLSLCHEDKEDKKIVMTLPPVGDELYANDPIPSEESLDLGPSPNFPANKNPR